MPGPNFVLDKGFTAEAAIAQFNVVKVGTNPEGCTPVTATNDAPLGIAQEAASAANATNGRVINVRLLGISRCIGNGVINRGSRVRAHSSGQVVALAGTAGLVEFVVGIATTASATTGDHIDVLLTPGVTSNSAVS
jgi:hypothetical protein